MYPYYILKIFYLLFQIMFLAHMMQKILFVQFPISCDMTRASSLMQFARNFELQIENWSKNKRESRFRL